MPADTKAIAYEWRMTDEDAAIIKFRWEPDTKIVSSMSIGTLRLMERGRPDDDEWEVFEIEGHVCVWEDMIWVVAQAMARKEGFAIEVPIYGEVDVHGEVRDDLPPPSAMNQDQQ